jgi:uncharacterized damage-inducible protein DinB
VTDLKPPRLAGDGRATLSALLQFQRESMLRKVDGLDDEAAGRRLVDSETTLLWLVQHLAHAETLWLQVRFRGHDPDVLEALALETGTTLAEAVAAYRATWARVDAIVANADLDDLVADDQDLGPVNLRWILGHLLEETARHAGHADILRELIDGSTGR